MYVSTIEGYSEFDNDNPAKAAESFCQSYNLVWKCTEDQIGKAITVVGSAKFLSLFYFIVHAQSLLCFSVYWGIVDV